MGSALNIVIEQEGTVQGHIPRPPCLYSTPLPLQEQENNFCVSRALTVQDRKSIRTVT